MEPIIQVNDVSMRFNLAKEKSESLPCEKRKSRLKRICSITS